MTVLKPVCGVEKNLEENLRSTCLQDYPDFQVVLSLQDPNDSALPLLRRLESELGPERVTVAVEDRPTRANGKIENLLVGLPHARHEILVISDSDVRVPPDYLRVIVPPLFDEQVGCVCTLYRAVRAERWFEKLETLTLNVDFLPNLIFARVTGASGFCLGASTALRKRTLEEIGGLESLIDYLVEDYEMGRRIRERGYDVTILPVFVDTMVDLRSFRHWWSHQVYLEQNTRAARPVGFVGTAVIRSVPFALLFAVARLGDPLGLGVLAAAIVVRLGTAGWIVGRGLRDRETLRALWLLPLRDVLALASWAVALGRRTVVWRGLRFTLSERGRMGPLGVRS